MRTAASAALVAAAACAAMLFAPSPARADSTYAEANEAFVRGEYQDAVDKYEALVSAGVVHPDLYYNLGNAYFRVGMLGQAIYNYERALRIAPGFDDARYNLALARDTVAERVVDRVEDAEKEPWLIGVVTFFTMSQLSIAFLVLNVLFFGGLVVLRFLATGFTRTSIVVATVFAGVAFAVSASLLGGHIYYRENVDVGIVLPEQTQLRDAADAASAPRTPIHAGLEVRIVRREPGWLQVRLVNGAEGWVPESAIGEL